MTRSLTVSCLLLLSLVVASSDGLSCLPCEDYRHKCREANCTTSIVKDVCNCCPVCAKDVGESCGGLWGIHGQCDKGLHCSMPSPSTSGRESGFRLELFSPGVCRPRA